MDLASAGYLTSPTRLRFYRSISDSVSSVSMSCDKKKSIDKAFKETLIKNVKKEVKQMMEEAVTKKYVHEESSSITSLCAAVEACLSQGIRRRVLGLFKSGSTTALLHKVAKNFEPAAVISQKVQDIENSDPNRPSSSSGESTNRSSLILSNSISVTKPPLQKKNSANSGLSSQPPRYLWIRLALFDKVLARIIDHLVQNSSKYYEKDSLIADEDYGSILSSLLVGPCALDFSRTKTQDHMWTDPPADELVQRHRISSGHSTLPACRTPHLNYRRSLHAVNSEENHRQIPISAKDYVESLHQNSRATLLYGKNNVLVSPKDMNEPMPGYLSLHQTAHSLTIKWTPNQLMNGYSESDGTDKSIYWEYALNVRVDDIVYVHCHQHGGDNGGTIVLVGQDGVQRPPIHFPAGGHLLAFLSCLENGLLPHGQLDPPLWSQRGKGKVFPKLRRKGRILSQKTEVPEEESSDYVFQIISKTRHEDFLSASKEFIDAKHWFSSSNKHVSPRARAHLISSSTNSSSSSCKSLSIEPGGNGMEPVSPPPSLSSDLNNEDCKLEIENTKSSPGETIQLVCETMKRQIISRAFYGWLAYCRHLCTVRTHLSGLVNAAIISGEGAENGLTTEKWAELMKDDGKDSQTEVFRLAYYGGVAHDIRKEVWPYLLGHYTFGSSAEEREQLDETTKHSYETTMSEWLAVGAIIRQRDKEIVAASLAKLSSESTSGEQPPPTPALAQELSNDVFEDNISLSDDDPPIVDDYEGENENENEGEGEDEQKKKKVVATKCPPNSLEKHSSSDNTEILQSSSTLPTLEKVVEIMNNKMDKRHSAPCGGNIGHLSVLTGNGAVPRSVSPDEGMGDEADIEDEEEDKSSDPSKQNGQSQDQNLITDNSQTITKPMSVVVTSNQSVDSGNHSETLNGGSLSQPIVEASENEVQENMLAVCTGDEDGEGGASGQRSACISPASSQGGVYSSELIETFGLNIHRIDKDVDRCDRNYWYFTPDNLEKLRNVMCTYVWEHLDVGYMQGMCDLVAPLLVIFDNESMTYACFCKLMDRMGANFPHSGGTMDTHFANMRSLIQILDSEMFELMHQNGDYTHFYFCYRWFLLDFKRELVYEDVFTVWETIWAAKLISSAHFMLFIALSLVETYRDIILSNVMDFTDIIKFFNEMAERHDCKAVLTLARDLVLQLQTLIENK
ncbi:small G protein signaling modulator 2 isoform X1 [Bemisia tabaci]